MGKGENNLKVVGLLQTSTAQADLHLEMPFRLETQAPPVEVVFNLLNNRTPLIASHIQYTLLPSPWQPGLEVPYSFCSRNVGTVIFTVKISK